MPMRFYKYTKCSTAKLILENCCIRWSSPARFNDPYEFEFPLTVAFEKEELRDLFHRRAEEVLRSPTEPAFHQDSRFGPRLLGWWALMRHWPIERFRIEIESVFESVFTRFQSLLDSEAERWKRAVEDYRILCVSERNDSILMWSHYAEDHKGVVLCLRAIKELDTPLCAASPVRYSETIPVFATLQEWVDEMLGMIAVDHSDQFYKQAYTKHIDWAYEREWRLLLRSRPTDAGGYENMPFHHQELESLYLGCRIAPEDRETLLGMLTRNWSDVRVFQAYQLPKSFVLDFRQIR